MKRVASVFSVVLSVVFLDQITKYLIVKYLSPFDSIDVLPFLHIVSVRNTGAAFGMFKGFGSAGFIGISLVAIVFVIILLKKKMYNSFALSLVLGGAIGNLIDRVLYGKVVDFVDVSLGSFHWPAFNVADSALTIGIVLIFIASVREKK